ncbi:hypothetical protein J3R83DRAFT_12525 [Lanmaoa asiatica]|nr:hypothetical protein J3R83DRAFT_12525 [Lanmaoa asiatica]
MLRLDWFNDWLGQVEGYQILSELMKDGDLSLSGFRDQATDLSGIDKLGGKLNKYNISEVLESKLYGLQCKDMWRKLGYPQSNPLRIFGTCIHGYANVLLNDFQRRIPIGLTNSSTER